MYVSALPKESKSNEMCWNKRKTWKKHPDIIDRNFGKNLQILIIFGKNISDTTDY